MNINEKEREMIRYLRQGKRLNISKIARKLRLPISTVSDRIKKIEEKYITKRSSLLDYFKMGYTAPCLLAIKAHGDKDCFLEYLKLQPCVNTIYHTNSNFSFLVELVCKNNFEMLSWIQKTEKMFTIELTKFHILKIEDKEMFVPQ